MHTDKKAAMGEYGAVDKLSEGLTAVLTEMMRVTGMNPSQLARSISAAPSTLNRVITAEGRSKGANWSLSAVTLGKLCERSNVSVTFKGGTVFVTKEGDRESTQDVAEVRLLRAWRALDPDDQKAFLKMLRGFLPPDKVDDILGGAIVGVTR